MNSGVKHSCDLKEIALKSSFLGPQAENAAWLSKVLEQLFERWVGWRQSRFPDDGRAITSDDQTSEWFSARRKLIESVAFDLSKRFEGEVPKFSPRYVGHMFSEVSLPALIGHIVTLLHNPNNISGESSLIGTQIEKEAIQELLQMVGFSTENGTGHFTSGGTVANLEALMRAHSRYSLWLSAGASLLAKGKAGGMRLFEAAHMGWDEFDRSAISPYEQAEWSFGDRNPFELSGRLTAMTGNAFLGPVMLVPENKHYSWIKGCKFLGLGAESLWPIALDDQGKLSLKHLKHLVDSAIEKGRPILMVVSVLGTTELGGIDPIDEVQRFLDFCRERHGIHIWHHVDAAYGGYFRAMNLTSPKIFSKKILQDIVAVAKVDSVTLDPHKLGYVPYSSGVFLTRDSRDYYFSAFEDAPYIHFDQDVDRGPYTLEGSRPATGAAAAWMTAKTMGLDENGYGLLLERTIRIARNLASALLDSQMSIRLAPGCDTNIVCFSIARKSEKISVSNERVLRIFEAFSPQAEGPFIVSKTHLRWSSYGAYLDAWTKSWGGEIDTEEVVLIRMCLMNPFFGSAETKVRYIELFLIELRGLVGD